MNYEDVIGTDVSKKTLDVFIHSSKTKNSEYLKVNILFVIEFTGVFSNNLALFFQARKYNFYLVSGLEIKRSIGIARGKDDKVDAKRITTYGYRLREELKPTELPEKDIFKLKLIMSLKRRLIKQRAGFKAKVKEQKLVFKTKNIS